MSPSIASATLCSASLRARGVIAAHAGNAAAAAVTAASTSAPSLDATSSMTSPVAGATTTSVWPLRAGAHAPPMKFSRAIPRPPDRAISLRIR
jgi:hypothetical protein